MRPLLKRITMNPKLAKLIVKSSLSVVVSVAIGYMIKAEKRIEEAIDEHYESSETS
jgi:hypothetical protein